MKALAYIIATIGILVTHKTYGQLNPMGSSYFHNQYLANPAMAGIEQGLQLDGGYKVQWASINGAPSVQTFTATYGETEKKIGFGLNINNENAGVLVRTAINGTYSYHLPLNDNHSFIDLGISAGATNERIDYDKVRGDLADPSLEQFNRRALYVDGDFGFNFRNHRLSVQGAVPNLKRFFRQDFRKNVMDYSLYMIAASYKFLKQDFNIEPKLMYRVIDNYKDIVDLGVQFQWCEDQLFLNTIYHSTNSMTFGIGIWYQKQLRIFCSTTSNTSDLTTYTSGEFEIGIKYQFR